MARRPKPEEIVSKLRQVDVLVSQGKSVAESIRSIGVTEVTYYRWRKEFGGLKADQVKRLKDLETENTRLRKAVADLTLDKLILKEAAAGNFCPSACNSTRLRRAEPLAGSAPRVGASASSMCNGISPCPSAACAWRSVSTARHSARRRGAEMTRTCSWPISSRWPVSMAAMAIGGSRLCCAMRAGL